MLPPSSEANVFVARCALIIDPREPVPDEPAELLPDAPELLPPAPVEATPDDPGGNIGGVPEPA